jgi:Phosphotransferase enzyme family
VDRAAAEDWIREHLRPAGPVETFRERPWSTVLRVPLSEGCAWLKACAPVQAFEPELTAQLFARWPDRVPEVLAHDAKRAWLLLADAGRPVSERGFDAWVQAMALALPRYAELQRGEAAHARDHLAHGVPDLRLATWPAQYEELLRRDLPLTGDETSWLARFTPGFAELCARLAGYGVPETVQHDDLHTHSLYPQGGRLRVLDWGDASVSHPFVSLVVTFRFLEEAGGLRPGGRWHQRLRDAYLEPWGPGLPGAFGLAIKAGAFAHAFAWARQRDALLPGARPGFDGWFAVILRRALAAVA